jgi:hypothetical protein
VTLPSIPIFIELIFVEDSLREALPGAEEALEAGARQVIKDAIDLNLSPPKISAENMKNVNASKVGLYLSGLLSDALTRFQTDQGVRAAASAEASIEDDQWRPFRVRKYAKRLVDLLPGELPINFYRSCILLGLEESINAFESPKGEAALNKYFGEPRGYTIDISMIPEAEPVNKGGQADTYTSKPDSNASDISMIPEAEPVKRLGKTRAEDPKKESVESDGV